MAGIICVNSLCVTNHSVDLITEMSFCICSAGKDIPGDIPVVCDLSACVCSSFFYTTNHYLKYLEICCKNMFHLITRFVTREGKFGPLTLVFGMRCKNENTLSVASQQL